LGSVALRLVLNARYFGFYTGDDVEILQEAFRRAVGLQYSPWEIRNLLLAEGLVAPVVGLARWLGVESRVSLVRIASAPFAIMGGLNIWLVYHLARRWLRQPRLGLLAAGLYASASLPVAFSSMIYPRTASTAAVLAAALWLSSAPRRISARVGAGALAALAFACRYSEIIFLAPLVLLAVVVCREHASNAREGEPRRWHVVLAALAVVGGFVVGALITVGLWDAWSWGRPFASLRAFAIFTLVEGRSSSRVVEQPWFWYLLRLPRWLAPTLLPLLPVAGLGVRKGRSAVLWSFVLVPLIALSAIHHKEIRYLQGIVPFLAVLAAGGAGELWRRGWRRAVPTLIVVSIAFGLATSHSILQRKSLAATRVALALAADSRIDHVALSQVWAYGDRLFFPETTTVTPLPTPVTAASLQALGPEVDAVALYAQELEEEPTLRVILEEQGFRPAGIRKVGRSRPVTLILRSSDASTGAS
jgi:hypothetical protein